MISIQIVVLLSSIAGFSATHCNFDARLSQALLNQGFHRNVTYNVKFNENYESLTIYDRCFIGIDQMLPAGVYAYPEELGDLKRTNKLIAIPKNRVNVELPAEEAQPTSVFIVDKIQEGEANLWLPIHARYHQAVKGGGFFRNEITPPRMYLRCPHIRLEHCEPRVPTMNFFCGAGTEICSWKEITFTLLTNPVHIMSVPVGNLDHNDIVAPVTIAAVIILSLYLLKTLHEYKLSVMKKGLKF